jgi:ABC-type phosphate transport system substrate-binding protein
MAGQGPEPALQAINSESASGTRSEEDRPRYFKQIFAKQKWHKPYADALMEGDSHKLASAIAKAEHAIFHRYLELSTAQDHSEERMDLCRAVEALRELEGSVTTAPKPAL